LIYDPVPPFRRDFDAARDPYTARNALGITTTGGGGGVGTINGMSGPAITIAAGSGISVANGSNTVTITNTAGGGGGISDAPNDGNIYGRQSLAWVNLGLSYQPLDGDLTALAALGGTNTIYYRSAANTWTAVTVGTGLSFSGGTLANTVSTAGFAPINNPVFTGDPQAPTPATADNDTSIATTAFVKAQGYLTGNQTITLSSDVTGSGTTAIATTIANNAVTNAKAADMATGRIKARITASTGDPEDATGTQVTTLLDTFTSSLKGLAPSSGGGTSNFLRADGTWAAPAGGGNVVTSGTITTGDLARWASATSIQSYPIATLFTSPALTGTPTVPTAAAGTSTTQAASTAFVTTAAVFRKLKQTSYTTAGSGTHTIDTNCISVEFTIVGGGGGGGGGGGAGADFGGNGGDSTVTGIGTAGGGLRGFGPANNSVPGGGGSATGGNVANLRGSDGATGTPNVSGSVHSGGGNGGASSLGGAGGGVAATAGGGGSNGSGGAGGGANAAAFGVSGGGGGSGATVLANTNTPAASYAYTVGAAGTAGPAGANGAAGGTGGAGVIIIKEYLKA